MQAEEYTIEYLSRRIFLIDKDIKERTEELNQFKELLKEKFKSENITNFKDDEISVYTSNRPYWKVPKDLKVTIGLDEYDLSVVKQGLSDAEKAYKAKNEPDSITMSMTVKEVKAADTEANMGSE